MEGRGQGAKRGQKVEGRGQKAEEKVEGMKNSQFLTPLIPTFTWNPNGSGTID